MGNELTSIRVLDIFDAVFEWIRTELGTIRMVYKPIPYIYSNIPSQEDLYALFRHNAVLHTRSIASVVDMAHRLPMSKGRKSAVKQAYKQGLRIDESNELSTFWQILEQVLRDKHQSSPVHSLEEMQLLQSRFPDHIRLYAVYSADGRMLAGTVIYEMPQLVHAQYIASSPEGKDVGAVDALYVWLMDERYADKDYLDFGTSTEQGGLVLNEGLIRQKEAFGARSVVYDSYVIDK